MYLLPSLIIPIINVNIDYVMLSSKSYTSTSHLNEKKRKEDMKNKEKGKEKEVGRRRGP